SLATEHRAEVDRLLGLVDLVVWVTDPQKYADQVLHDRYLRAFKQHGDITVAVLNQADRLSPNDVIRCVDDLAGLLATDGLAEVLTTDPGAGQEAALRAAVRDVVEPLVDRLPAPWATRLADTARAATDDLAERLRATVTGASIERGDPAGWRLLGLLRWLALL